MFFKNNNYELLNKNLKNIKLKKTVKIIKVKKNKIYIKKSNINPILKFVYLKCL